MKTLTFLLLLLTQCVYGQHPQLKTIVPKIDASFRGLSVVDDGIAWVSGTKGWVGHSENGGQDWTFAEVKGYEKCDFRSLYAFDAKNAIIANAGIPEVILRTADGGVSWKVVYKNDDTAAFFDGVDFWNEHDGIMYGDPLQGRMMVLRTKDGGQSWQELPASSRPLLDKDEASFAASGTCIRCTGKNKVIIATGGKVSRLWVSEDRGNKWHTVPTPILHGENSTGIFSFAFHNEQNGIIVGGDYKRDSLKTDHIFYTINAGGQWKVPKIPTGGYRECVTYLTKEMVIATGPSGTDISNDGGVTWHLLSAEKGYHVIKKSRKGSVIIMAGTAGKISLLQ
jgi:photosystem II stability/assembly factor-like uncharacterized protein